MTEQMSTKPRLRMPNEAETARLYGVEDFKDRVVKDVSQSVVLLVQERVFVLTSGHDFFTDASKRRHISLNPSLTVSFLLS